MEQFTFLDVLAFQPPVMETAASLQRQLGKISNKLFSRIIAISWGMVKV